MGNQASSAGGGGGSSSVYTGAPPPRKAKPLYEDMEEAWKLIGAFYLGFVVTVSCRVDTLLVWHTHPPYTRPRPSHNTQPPACRTATGYVHVI